MAQRQGGSGVRGTWSTASREAEKAQVPEWGASAWCFIFILFTLFLWLASFWGEILIFCLLPIQSTPLK